MSEHDEIPLGEANREGLKVIINQLVQENPLADSATTNESEAGR